MRVYEGVLGGEGPFGFGYFSQLTVETFDRVSGVNEAADLGAKVEHSAQALPVAPPVCDGRGIFFAPFFLQLVQGSKCGSFVRGLVDMLEVCAKRAVILVTEVLDGFAHLVNDTNLLQRVEECRLNSLPYTRKVVRTHEQDVLHAPSLEIVEHLQPIFGRLRFAQVKAQNIPFALHINANGRRDRYGNFLTTRTDLVADAVEIDDSPTGQPKGGCAIAPSLRSHCPSHATTEHRTIRCRTSSSFATGCRHNTSQGRTNPGYSPPPRCATGVPACQSTWAQNYRCGRARSPTLQDHIRFEPFCSFDHCDDWPPLRFLRFNVRRQLPAKGRFNDPLEHRSHQFRQTCSIIKPLYQSSFRLFRKIRRTFDLCFFHTAKKVLCESSPKKRLISAETVF